MFYSRIHKCFDIILQGYRFFESRYVYPKCYNKTSLWIILDILQTLFTNIKIHSIFDEEDVLIFNTFVDIM